MISRAASLSQDYHCCPWSHWFNPLSLFISPLVRFLFKCVLSGRENLRRTSKKGEKKLFGWWEGKLYQRFNLAKCRQQVDCISVFCTEWQCSAVMWNGDVVKLSESRQQMAEEKGAVTLPDVQGGNASNLFPQCTTLSFFTSLTFSSIR